VLFLPKNALHLVVIFDQSKLIPRISYTAVVGQKSEMKVNITDVFVLKMFAIQRNVFAAQTAMSSTSGSAEETTCETQKLMQIVENLRCDLRGLSSSSSSDQYFFETFNQTTAPLIATFHRRTTWDEDHLFELIPLNTLVEDTRIDIPQLHLQRVLADVQSVQQRLLQMVQASLYTQLYNLMFSVLSSGNVAMLLKKATAGLRGSSVLAEKASELEPMEVAVSVVASGRSSLQTSENRRYTDDEIVHKHFGERGTGLKAAQTIASFDRRLWLLLSDWDASHVDDRVEGAAAGAAVGAALAVVMPPVGVVTGVVAAIGGGVVGSTSAGAHRRCLALAIHNHTSRRVSITNLVKEEATNLVETTNLVMEPSTTGHGAGGHDDGWDSKSSTVIFAAASPPVGRSLFETGMLGLLIDCDCLRIRATNDFVRIYSKDVGICFNIVSMDVHHWWSRWVLVISDANINLQAPLTVQQPVESTTLRGAKCVSTTLSSPAGTGSVMLTFDGTEASTSEPEPEPETESEPKPEPEPEPESGSDSDDCDDFQSVQGDEQLMSDLVDDEGNLARLQRSARQSDSGSPVSASELEQSGRQAGTREPEAVAVALGLPSVPGVDSVPKAKQEELAAISTMSAMGFSEQQARGSLMACNGDVTQAIEHALLVSASGQPVVGKGVANSGAAGAQMDKITVVHAPVAQQQPGLRVPRGTVRDEFGDALIGDYRVQFQRDGKFSKMIVQAGHAVCGGELIFTRPQGQQQGPPLVCDLTTPGTRVGQPKTPRKGRPWCLRVTLGRPDSRGAEKYLIDFGCSAQMVRWRSCLAKLIRGDQYGYTLRRRQGVSGDIKDTVAEGRKARGGRADDDDDYEFGDWLRGVAAKGKQDRLNEARLSGAPGGGSHGDSGSELGDFMRGLFK
jgi:hypothetical protein